MIDTDRQAAPAPRRRIHLVADDYGISPSVDAAIRDLIARGRLSATSVMVAAPTFGRDEAEALAALSTSQRFSIGLHLTLTAPFAPLSAGYTPVRNGIFLPLRTTALRAFLGHLNVAALVAECTAQLDAFSRAFGRPPDFVDGHQHVHLFPPIGHSLLRAMKRAAPAAWVRQCGRAAPWYRGGADRKGLVLDLLSRRFKRLAEDAGVATNPAFAGTYNFHPGANFAELFAGFLTGLPDASVIMCHPGIVDAELTRLDPLTSLREREYRFLGSDEFMATLERCGVALA